MKVCLIKPPILHKGVSFARFATPPLGLAYIAGVLHQENHEVQIVDASAEGHDKIELFNQGVYLFGLNKEEIVKRIDPETDLIGFSFMFTNNWLYDRELVKYVKEKLPNAILIAGGEHATAAPRLCFEQSSIDYIVIGEGEDTIVELVNGIQNKSNVSEIEGLAYYSKGEVVQTKMRGRIKDLNNLPLPKWDIFPLSSYFDNKMSFGVYLGNTLPILATRGCPYICTFCSNPLMWGKKYLMRSPKNFVDELEFLHLKYNVVNFDLYDLTAIIFKDWILEMCNEIIDRELKITYQLPSGTRSEAIDYEVACKLFESGCKNITYAPESGSAKVLRTIKKKIKVNKMLESINYSYKAGLNVKLNMIIGFPEDTHADIWRSFWFLVKCSWYGANDAAPAIFSPYPGSSLFNDLEKGEELSIDDDEYLYEIINSYDLWPGKIYCKNISSFAIKIYLFVFLAIFYGSNYLFRPMRLFKTIKNIIEGKQESRIEQLIQSNFFKNFFLLFKRKKE